MYTPTGKLGKVVWEGKEFQIQTEFLHTPRPHIVTTVFLGGEVVHRVDQPWIGGVETDEDKRALDRQLVWQHRETIAYLEAKARRKAEAKRVFAVEDLQRLAAHPRAIGCLSASSEGVLQMEAGLSDELKETAFLFSELVVLLAFLEKNTKLGRFREGDGDLGNTRLFLGQVPGLFVGLALKGGAEDAALREEFEKLLPAGPPP